MSWTTQELEKPASHSKVSRPRAYLWAQRTEALTYRISVFLIQCFFGPFWLRRPLKKVPLQKWHRSPGYFVHPCFHYSLSSKVEKKIQ